MSERPFSAHAFNQYLDEKKLMGSRCNHCGASHLPPRAICPACQGEALEWFEASGAGRLVAYTSVYVVPSAMAAQGFGRDRPYLSGLVELEEGVTVSARILGLDPQNPAAIRIGQPLRVAFLESAEGEAQRTGLAFEPA